MILEISLTDKNIVLHLRAGNQPIDTAVFPYYHDPDRQLITFLDKLLKKHKIDINSVKSYKILGNMSAESTAHKMVEALVEGLKA